MERRNFLNRLGAGTLATCTLVPLVAAKPLASNSEAVPAPLQKEEIQHMVIFELIHEKESEATAKFLNDGRRILTKIPGVQNFQVFDQVSKKNDYSYGFSMIFENQQAYDAYSNHPDHVGFVENRWKKEVKRFLEIDFKVH